MLLILLVAVRTIVHFLILMVMHLLFVTPILSITVICVFSATLTVAITTINHKHNSKES